MAGAQFEYDEKGTTFYYFLISFFGIVLVPLTYYVQKATKLPGYSNTFSIVKYSCKLRSCSDQLFIFVLKIAQLAGLFLGYLLACYNLF